MKVRYSIQFVVWLKIQNEKIQQYVASRLQRIEAFDHFGDYKPLGDGLMELRFANGTRIYYFRTGRDEILVVLGGNKNGQKKDIKKAKSFRNG